MIRSRCSAWSMCAAQPSRSRAIPLNWLNTFEAGVNKGGFTIYFTDLDGITLELLQPPA